jgi:hypothetical protein
MTLPTYGSLVTKVQNDYDLTDENFISSTELLGLFNEGLKDVEKIIHELHHEDKYFIAPGTITLVSGTQDYSLPADIYLNKLRHVAYDNGSEKYEITKNRHVQYLKFVQPSERYQYLLVNPSTGIKMRLYPTPLEAGAYVSIFYIREIRRFTSDTADATNTLEIPGAENLVLAHVRRGVAWKMRRQDLIAAEDARLKEQVAIFELSLKEMVPDENNLALMDMQSYIDQGMMEVFN